MKALFVTDFHGARWKYNRLVDLAHTIKPDVVINGGDMLPKDGSLFDQHGFIKMKLNHHFASFEEMGIPYLCYLGNDDLRIWDDLFDEVCSRYECVYNLAQRNQKIGGFEFVGMNWVTDYPFRLKDRCRIDGPGYTFQPQFGSALLSTPEGWQPVDNWPQYAQKLPSLADELNALKTPRSMNRSVYVLHMPPSKLGLDVCLNGQEVGSDAVYDFILENKPRLTLHGHIHESPDISGAWKSQLGESLCIQPGQLEEDELTYVVVDLDSMTAERTIEKIKKKFGWLKSLKKV